MDSEFVKRLKLLVDRAGGQVQFAALLKVKQATLSKWCNGTKVPVQVAAKMAEVSGVSLQWLATGRESPGAASAFAAIDMRALKEAIARVEAYLAERHEVLEPPAKARAIGEAYAVLDSGAKLEPRAVLAIVRRAVA